MIYRRHFENHTDPFSAGEAFLCHILPDSCLFTSSTSMISTFLAQDLPHYQVKNNKTNSNQTISILPPFWLVTKPALDPLVLSPLCSKFIFRKTPLIFTKKISWLVSVIFSSKVFLRLWNLLHCRRQPPPAGSVLYHISCVCPFLTVGTRSHASKWRWLICMLEVD